MSFSSVQFVCCERALAVERVKICEKMDRAKVIEGGRGTGSGRVCSGGELGQVGSRGRGGVLGQLHHPPDGMYAVVAEQSVLVAACVLEVEERRALHGLPGVGQRMPHLADVDRRHPSDGQQALRRVVEVAQLVDQVPTSSAEPAAAASRCRHTWRQVTSRYDRHFARITA